jgi:hypothetical protein
MQPGGDYTGASDRAKLVPSGAAHSSSASALISI